MHKTTGDVWDQYRYVIPQMRAGTHRDNNSGANHAVFQAQNDRRGLVPIETCCSGPKVAVLYPKTTDEGWDK